MVINSSNGSYRASLKYQPTIFTDIDIQVEIPQKAIDALINLGKDESFLSLKKKDIFPGIMILDGMDVTFDLKSKEGRLNITDNSLGETINDGIIVTSTNEYYTGIDLISKEIKKAIANHMSQIQTL